MVKYNIYADGACSQNGTWEGGWGYLVTDEFNDIIHKDSGYEKTKTTNQRMEIQSILEGLKYIQENTSNMCDISVYTDSMYCVRTINEWLPAWELCNIIYSKANSDQWNEFIKLRDIQKKVTGIHVKGHNGHEFNEICNQLAQGAIKTKGAVV